jgi:NAD(P)H-flavin reductase
MGTMTLDPLSTRDIVCIAGGTGVAPIKALIGELAAYNRSRWVHVFFGAKTRADLYDLPALQRLAPAIRGCRWYRRAPMTRRLPERGATSATSWSG